jgi:hypothetical protein
MGPEPQVSTMIACDWHVQNGAFRRKQCRFGCMAQISVTIRDVSLSHFVDTMYRLKYKTQNFRGVMLL